MQSIYLMWLFKEIVTAPLLLFYIVILVVIVIYTNYLPWALLSFISFFQSYPIIMTLFHPINPWMIQPLEVPFRKFGSCRGWGAIRGRCLIQGHYNCWGLPTCGRPRQVLKQPIFFLFLLSVCKCYIWFLFNIGSMYFLIKSMPWLRAVGWVCLWIEGSTKMMSW